MSAPSTTTEGAAHVCERCGRGFATLMGRGQHRKLAHGLKPECGTNSAYSAGCKCARCREAHAAYGRRYRAMREERTLRACLLSVRETPTSEPAITPEALDAALASGWSIEGLHWGWYRSTAAGPLLKHCRCALPEELATEMEAS